ncbi:MAG TPA: cytochrome c biogenesis protein CcdA [Ferruginibacter sp.]|jgi:thiol:disulfide interchange protein|nr:cytochrome c biogenesis protein CcdA [Ferruginibacter sp.]
MKYFYSFIIFILLTATQFAIAQTAKPVWKFSSSKDKSGNIVLVIEATIPNGTIIYSNTNPTNNLDLPLTTFDFDSSIADKIGIVSTSEKGELKKKDTQLNAEVNYFEKTLDIDLTLQIKGNLPYIKGHVNYMAFDGKEFIGPEPEEFYLTKQPDGTYAGGEFQLTKAKENALLLSSIDLNHPVNDCGTTATPSGLLTIFILGFLGGLIALITPCVFPMIPLTVSFFTKKTADKSKGIRDAILYGLFIFLIYVSLSIPFHIAGHFNKEIYNNISTNIYLNLIFFAIFVVFAISFFGYFEIVLPASVVNKTDAKSSKSFIGIFFMALTLAIVSFSCTGPILGSLLASTASGGEWPLTAGLAGFGLALGFPFALFAMFPQFLSSLPKSGGWLDTVKVVLGFIELGLAIKFFSNADLVAHWGILKREIFFAIWIAIGLLTFAYLMGWFSFKKQYTKPTIGVGRKIVAVTFLAFALYLIPGVTNTKYARLSLVSGFPPSTCYSIYAQPVNCNEPLKDYFEAVKLAKEENKPIMIDFTGYACVNCRKMEENVWPDEKVKELMDKYVLVSLYVDDRKALPVDQQILYTTKDGTQKKILTVGDKWATFESENFIVVSQPYYVLLSPDGKLLNNPVGYTPDPVDYASWLECGLDAFKK